MVREGALSLDSEPTTQARGRANKPCARGASSSMKRLICIGNFPVGCSTTKHGGASTLSYRNIEWTRECFIRRMSRQVVPIQRHQLTAPQARRTAAFDAARRKADEAARCSRVFATASAVVSSDRWLNRQTIGHKAVTIEGLQNSIAGRAAIVPLKARFGREFDTAEPGSAVRANNVALLHPRPLEVTPSQVLKPGFGCTAV
jgi:hypothetical protein